ncbi:alpha/beta hydrolase [Stagonosporopsis vannaccii]|nr:alpha/beta hydrolase [Stagonosporopsis vannaccii]
MTSALGRFRLPAPQLCLIAGASLGGLLFLRHVSTSLRADKFKTLLSPRETSLPGLSRDELEKLPYPPDALPGARDVDSPYGSIRVYEWGPEDGEGILLIHGISTPSIALADVAHKLVEKGCRVMLFDLFSRGYSSGPSPHTHRHDSSLYTSQIHICLLSSPLRWTLFTIIGYSFGGALAADFASYFPCLIRGLVLIAPGGLIRGSHTTWKSKVLYSTSGIVPEIWVERLVAQRLYTGPEEVARSIEPEADTTVENAESRKVRASGRDPVYASSHHPLLKGRPASTVGAVVDWQIEKHEGFVPAFISSIRYAPVHGEHERWRILGRHVSAGVGGLKKVHVVLGEVDPIIVKDEIVEDATGCLGKENVEFEIVEGVGHEVAIERADDIVRVVGSALEKW